MIGQAGPAIPDANEHGVAIFDLDRKQCRTGWVDKPPEPRQLYTAYSLTSPDGSYVLSWGESKKTASGTPTLAAVVHDPETLECKRTFTVDAVELFAFALSPDGQWLAVGDTRGELSLWGVATGEKFGAWAGHRNRINQIGFMGPGWAVTSSEDLTALLWDLRAEEKPGKPLWDALAGDDALEAYRAVWVIADDPKGPELLRTKVAPAKPAAADKVKQLIADLGADRFAVREAATKELQALGRLAEPDLRAARARATSEEVRTRLDALLAKVPRERSHAEVVQARAVAAMELSGSDAAKKLLADWAAGAAGARLTIDARAALTRLSLAR